MRLSERVLIIWRVYVKVVFQKHEQAFVFISFPFFTLFSMQINSQKTTNHASKNVGVVLKKRKKH